MAACWWITIERGSYRLRQPRLQAGNPDPRPPNRWDTSAGGSHPAQKLQAVHGTGPPGYRAWAGLATPRAQQLLDHIDRLQQPWQKRPRVRHGSDPVWVGILQPTEQTEGVFEVLQERGGGRGHLGSLFHILASAGTGRPWLNPIRSRYDPPQDLGPIRSAGSVESVLALSATTRSGPAAFRTLGRYFSSKARPLWFRTSMAQGSGRAIRAPLP